MADALDASRDSDTEFDAVRAVVVTEDGEPVLARYMGTTPEEYHPVQSVTKSVVSTLVGIAIKDGLLALDDTLAMMLPEYADRMTHQVASVTLSDLLTMRGGFIAEDSPRGLDFAFAPDAVADAVQTGSGATSEFRYSDAGAHLVSAILAQATGTSVLDYARKVLFDPLGVDTIPASELVTDPSELPAYWAADFAWPVDRQGIHQGWGLLKLRPVDMLALGHLYLNDGQWNGQHLVPADWVEAATSQHVEVPGVGLSYGYMWWRGEMAGREVFMASGDGGQLIVVSPELDLVAVTLTELDPSDLSSDLSPDAMRSLVERVIVAGYGRP